MSNERVDLEAIRRDLLECAQSWEPDARLVGNVRAGDIVALLEEVDRLRAENAKLLTHNVDAIQTSVEALKFSEDMRAEGRREGLQRAAELCEQAEIYWGAGPNEARFACRDAILDELKGGGT